MKKLLSFFLFSVTMQLNAQQVITVTSSTSNIRNNYFSIENPEVSFPQDAFLSIKQIVGAKQKAGKTVGIWYYPADRKWYIYNQDLTPMPAGLTYQIKYYRPTDYIEGVLLLKHTVTNTNVSGIRTVLSHSMIDNNRAYEVSVTAVYNPDGGDYGVYNKGEVQASYDQSMGKWVLQNKNGEAIPVGCGFNIVATPKAVANNVINNNVIGIKNKPLNSVTPRKQFFYVTINGFSVKNPTSDHVLEVDGKGDEVFFMGHSFMINTVTGESISRMSVAQSPVIGDISNDDWRGSRIKGGSKWGGSGGFQLGDNFGEDRGLYLGAPTMGKNSMPLLIAEGELEEGKTGMIVIPSIWEFDGTSEFQQSLNSFASAMAQVTVTAAASAAATIVFGPVGINFVVAGAVAAHGMSVTPKNNTELLNRLPIFAPLTFNQRDLNVIVGKNFTGDAKDRPIGMYDNGTDYRYAPLAMNLTYESAKTLSESDFGFGNGVLPLRFKDAPAMGGDYTIYICISANNIQNIRDGYFNPDGGESADKFYLRNLGRSNHFLINQAGYGAFRHDNVDTYGSQYRLWSITKKQNTRNSYQIKSADGSFLSVQDNTDDKNITVSTSQARSIWTIMATGNGPYMVINQFSGKALTLNYGNGKIEQAVYTGADNQHWVIGK